MFDPLLAFGKRWGAYIISLVFLVAYSIQSWIYAHTQISVLDEGAYLIKGLLFATGRYAPFQDYGPLTNHMPLAFLIPGWVQVLFGPGLRTGRYFAIFLGILMLIGLWFLVKRMRGNWWAAASIGIIAVNPALIKMYSVGVSQVLVSFLLVWTLFFALGPNRKLSHLLIASILAAAIWFTRINMAPVLLLLLAYIWWQYGWTTFWKCAIAGFGFLILGHMLYWPGILKLWAYWLPETLTPFLKSWRLPPDVMARWSPEISLGGRINSFLQAIRFNLLPFAGVVAGLILWNKKISRENQFEHKILIFLAMLFLFLFVLHAGASLAGDYCVYCFQVYLGFFDVVAIVFIVLSISFWLGDRSRTSNVVSIVAILIFVGGVTFSAADAFGDTWLRPRLVRNLLDLSLPDGTELWVLLQNKFGMQYQEIVNLTRRELTRWIPVLFGLIVATVSLLTVWFVRRLAKRMSPYSFSASAFGLLLVTIFTLSPTRILGFGYRTYDCAGDVITSYEIVGSELRRFVEPGKLVYWTGGDSAVPLLYIPKVEIFPPQLNDGYTFRIGGDTEIIHRLSYWDENLRTQWLDEADYLLIEDQFYDDFWIATGDWVQTAVTSPADSCRDGASIHVLQKVD